MDESLRVIFQAQDKLDEETTVKLIGDLDKLAEAMDKAPPTARMLEIDYNYSYKLAHIDAANNALPCMRQAVDMLACIERDSAHLLDVAGGYDEPAPRIKWRMQHHFSRAIPCSHQLGPNEGYLVVEFSAYQDNGNLQLTYFHRSHIVVLGPLRMPAHLK